MAKRKATTVICVCGVRGSGKTTHVRKRLAKLRGDVIAWDPLGEYTKENGLEGFERMTLDELGELMADRKYDERGVIIPIRASIAPGDPDVSITELDLDEAFSAWCTLVAELGDLTAVIEESSLVASPSAVPRELRNLIALGRHRGVSMILVAQRFAMLPRLATGSADEIVAFRQREPRDLDDLADRFGVEREARARFRLQLRGLKVGQCVTHDDATAAAVSAQAAQSDLPGIE